MKALIGLWTSSPSFQAILNTSPPMLPAAGRSVQHGLGHVPTRHNNLQSSSMTIYMETTQKSDNNCPKKVVTLLFVVFSGPGSGELSWAGQGRVTSEVWRPLIFYN